MTEVRATFPTATDAQSARNRLMAAGVPSHDITLQVAPPGLAEETAREGRTMGRIVVIIVLASIVGTVIGILIGASLHLLVGPVGTSGLIIQVVSWAIFAHLLIGLWAGYFLLADRTERELGRARPVILVIQCANIDADTLQAKLRECGSTDIRVSAQSAQ
jgi:hypothetical protein